MDNDSGIPKRNVILAVVLAGGFYIVWYALLPKPQTITATPAATQEKNANQVPGSTATDKTFIEPGAEQTQEFTLGGCEGKIALSYGAAIKELKCGPETLVGNGSYLATIPELAADWEGFSADGDEIRAKLQTKNGVITKTIRFDPDKKGFGSLTLALDKTAKYPQKLTILLQPNLPHGAKQQQAVFVGYKGKEHLIIRKPGKKHDQVEAEVAPGKHIEAVGVSSQYHVATIHGLKGSVSTDDLRYDFKAASWKIRFEVAPGEQQEFKLYLGLKTDKTVAVLGLDNLLYGGTLGPLERLVNQTLAFFYRLTGNHGAAIILLTLVFQIVVFPLTWKNMKITKKMKDLQPKIKQLQEKYKSDPQKMNTEMMQLYRTSGTNPLGGCFLLLLQMPIFIALYSALNENYDLYGSPFILWIRNLAAPDPTYVMPILMGAAMLLQAKLNSATIADPSQKMMGYMMPVMFTFFFLKFPSGLVLYWLTSNIISIGLNVMVPRIIDKA